jgi:hypothetical protein
MSSFNVNSGIVSVNYGQIQQSNPFEVGDAVHPARLNLLGGAVWDLTADG